MLAGLPLRRFPAEVWNEDVLFETEISLSLLSELLAFVCLFV